MLLTRPPLPLLPESVRLACVRHAASVYPEPGSNSPSNVVYRHPLSFENGALMHCLELRSRPSCCCTVVYKTLGCSQIVVSPPPAGVLPAGETKVTGTVLVLCLCFWCALTQPHACACAWPTAHHSCCSAFHSSIVKVALAK